MEKILKFGNSCPDSDNPAKHRQTRVTAGDGK